MKPRYLLILGFVLGAGVALAQQGTQGSAPDTKPAGLTANPHLETYLQNNNNNNHSAQVNQQHVAVAVTPKLQASGPLIEPFKPNQASSTPKRLLQLVNPFAPVEPQPAPQTRVKDMSTRAWSSVVGWNPGGSAFPGVRDSIYRPKASSSAGYVDFDARFRPSDALLITGKVGYTRGTGETPHDYGYEAFLINSPLVYQLHGTVAPAIVSFPGVDTTNFSNPVNVTNGGSWSDTVKVTDAETYGQLDGLVTLDRGRLQSVKVGLRYAKHDRSDFGLNYGCSLDPNNPCYTNPNQLFPPPAWYGNVSPSNFGAGIGMGPGYLQHFWIMDTGAIVAWESAYNGVITGQNLQGSFNVDEKDAAAYAMANFSGNQWRGNLGLRVVDTRQESDSWNLDANQNFVPASVKHDYGDVLPSANFRYDLTRDLVLRLAASKTMSRADYSALSPAVTLNNLNLTGTGGNADVRPIRSTNYDAALEWYFAPQSILALGVFDMEMPSYVTYGNHTQPYLDTQTAKIVPYLVTSPFNIAAHNHGVELSWQQPLGFGFGALANYTYADGHSADGMPLVGSSKSTGNAELYFEKHGFSVRTAYTYRSSFLVGLANVTSQYEAGLGTLAASINYQVYEHVMLTFDGLNLNNPVLKYYSNPQQPQAFYSNGRQYYLGARVSF